MSYEQFLAFWMAYPRKVGKGAAERVWAKLKGDPEVFGKILKAVENQKTGESWNRDNGIYIPHPATWLNQRRWEDEAVAKWVDPFKKTTPDPDRMIQAEQRLEALREREIQRIETIRGLRNNP